MTEPIVPTNVAGRGRLAEVLAARGGRAEPEAPLFRERDRDSMRFSFDLGSLDDVSNADAILHRVEAGTMPCDGAWPAERVAVFRRWINSGKPA